MVYSIFLDVETHFRDTVFSHPISMHTATPQSSPQPALSYNTMPFNVVHLPHVSSSTNPPPIPTYNAMTTVPSLFVYRGLNLNRFGQGQGSGRGNGSLFQCNLCIKLWHLVRSFYKRFDASFVGLTAPSHPSSGVIRPPTPHQNLYAHMFVTDLFMFSPMSSYSYPISFNSRLSTLPYSCCCPQWDPFLTCRYCYPCLFFYSYLWLVSLYIGVSGRRRFTFSLHFFFSMVTLMELLSILTSVLNSPTLLHPHLCYIRDHLLFLSYSVVVPLQ